MKSETEWFEDDTFWLSFAPFMFSERQWGAAEAEISETVSLLGLKKGDSVCDLCCGVGRHSVELAKHGLTVTGVDRTTQFLEAAAETAESNEVSVQFVQADIRDYVDKERYDAIINMFTSFGYFESPAEELQSLGNMYSSLKRGGKLLIELMGKEVLARIFQPTEWYEQDGTFVLMQRRIIEDWSKIQNRWILLKGGQKTDFTFTHRIYSARELMELLEEIGFFNVRCYGDLKGSRYDQQSERLVVVGEKRP